MASSLIITHALVLLLLVIIIVLVLVVVVVVARASVRNRGRLALPCGGGSEAHDDQVGLKATTVPTRNTKPDAFDTG